MDYINIWGIAALAGIACLGFFFLLTRRIGSLFVRTLLRCLGAVWLLLPAPVPNFPGNFAPAFVVWIFEGVLQSDGEPLVSIQILLWSSLAVSGLVLFWYLVFGRHKSATAAAADIAGAQEAKAAAAAVSVAKRIKRTVPATAAPNTRPKPSSKVPPTVPSGSS